MGKPAFPTGPERILDGHFHIFLKSLLLVDKPRHRPQYDATLEQYLKYQRQFGLAGGLLVQPSFLGADNSFLVDTLQHLAREAPHSCFKGVAVVTPETSQAELSRLNSRGVVGVRFNLLRKDIPSFDRPAWQALLERVDMLNWHVEIQIEGERLPAVLSQLTAACHRVVVDHAGRPDAEKPRSCPGYRTLVNDDTGRLWIKISGPYRPFPGLSRDEAANRVSDLACDYAAALGTNRLVWGSDWPWTQHEDGVNFERIMSWRSAWLERFDMRGIETLVPQIRLGLID